MDCYQSALRILRYRFNSEAELRRKLTSRRFDAEAIEATIARLREEKWIDDERFAGALVRTRAARKVGPGRIRRELTSAGVDRETAARALTENHDEEATLENVRILASKRRRIMARRHGDGYAESREGKVKLAAYLVNQGYDIALVRRIVDCDEE